MPLRSCNSYQICKPSSVFLFLFYSDIPPMNAMLDLLRVPGRKGFSTVKLAFLIAEILFAVSIVWFATPFIFGFLSSAVPRLWTHVRSSTAPPYLFVAVNFIILTIWKLSESRALNTDRHAEEENNSKPNLIPFRPRDLGSNLTENLLRKTAPEGCYKIPSISSGNILLPHYAEQGPSPIPAPESELSCVTTEEDTVSSSSSYGLPVPEPTLAPADIKTQDETMSDSREEGDSLDATWNAIMKKSGRWELSPSPASAVVGRTTGPVSAPKPRIGNAFCDGKDEMNQRFDDFIKKNYDQIRLKKPGEPNQPWRIN